MPKLIKSIKDKLTPHIFMTVSQHHNILTILSVSFVLTTVVFACVLIKLYNHILILQAAVNILGTK